MNTRIALLAVLPAVLCAAAFCAAEVWNTKDPAVWTTEDANVILNNSPWAHQIKVGGQQAGQRRGMGRRGGGMGYPGGGYPGGGGGYPGGGGGYPGGGGGYPGGGGGYPGGGRGGAGSMPMSALVRWESAQPVQQAEARLKNLTAADAKPEAKASDHYVVTLIGLRLPGSRNRNNDDDSDRPSTQSRDQLLTYTQLVIKNKAPIGPDDVKINNESGQYEIRFFFPKTNPITPADKEVTFQTMIGNQKVENKFELKKMTRNGKLELD